VLGEGKRRQNLVPTGGDLFVGIHRPHPLLLQEMSCVESTGVAHAAYQNDVVISLCWTVQIKSHLAHIYSLEPYSTLPQSLENELFLQANTGTENSHFHRPDSIATTSMT